MRLLSSIFLENSLSYKMPLRFNNLDIGGGFPLLQNAPSISTTVSYKDIPFAAKCQSHFQGLHMQRNIVATKCNVVFNIIHQDSSSIIIHSQINIDQYRSIQIMHIHASSCRIVLFESAWSFSLYCGSSATDCLNHIKGTKGPFDFYKPV